jgi:copper chaperone
VSTMTYVFRVEGMHCGSCALLIDETLDELAGVSRSQTTVKPGRSTVELDVSQTSPQHVVSAIEELGYRASPMP